MHSIISATEVNKEVSICLFTVWKTELEHNGECVSGKSRGWGLISSGCWLVSCVHLADRTRAAFRVLIDFWFNGHILTFVYVCVLTRDRWVWTGEHVCVCLNKSQEKGKGLKWADKNSCSCVLGKPHPERASVERRTSRVQISIWVVPWVWIAVGMSQIRYQWEGL